MGIEKKCMFHRNSDHSGIGLGIGYCDLGVVWAICDGDIKFCEEPDAFISNFYGNWRRDKEMDIRGNV
jgi:hypothetical protein